MTRRWIGPCALFAAVFALTLALGYCEMLVHPMTAHGMTYHQARYHTSQATVRSLIRAEARTWHYGYTNREALVKLAYRESVLGAVAGAAPVIEAAVRAQIAAGEGRG